MLLNALKKNNQALIDYSVYLHQKGRIQPDTYIIDLDSVLDNYRLIEKEASLLNIQLFLMLKQLGRNPFILHALRDQGSVFVAVDFREAAFVMEHRGHLGHVGHLVQVPQACLEPLLDYGVDYITLYSLEKAQQLHQLAKKKGIKQKVLLRVTEEPIYPGQETPVYTQGPLLSLARDIKKFSHLNLVGLTSFPCFMFNDESLCVEPTPNAALLKRFFDMLNDEGFELSVKNMPSHNSFHFLRQAQQWGATHLEPGHALTGSTPWHAHHIHSNEEKIALVYLSEVSHHRGGLSYVYGGGYYRRSFWQNALVRKSQNEWEQTYVKALPPEVIDYTLALEGVFPVGSAVISSFRTQIFVTRSHVAVVQGLSLGKPHLVGICDSLGNVLRVADKDGKFLDMG